MRPKGLAYVSEKYKVIFAPIPKNASTTIRHIERLRFKQSNFLAYRTKLEEGTYQAFAVIREPVARFVAAYIEICKRAVSDSPHILTKEFYWLRNPRKRFLKFVDEFEVSCFDSHLLSQKYFLVDYENNPYPIHAYIDMRKMDTALCQVLDSCGCPVSTQIPRMNVHDNKGRIFQRNMRNRVGLAHVRRSIYVGMDYAVRRLQRRPIPMKSEVERLINDDQSLMRRIHMLLAEDIAFYKEIAASWNDDGVLWRGV